MVDRLLLSMSYNPWRAEFPHMTQACLMLAEHSGGVSAAQLLLQQTIM